MEVLTTKKVFNLFPMTLKLNSLCVCLCMHESYHMGDDENVKDEALCGVFVVLVLRLLCGIFWIWTLCWGVQ